MVSVYISASFDRAAEMETIARDLRHDGISIASTWHAAPGLPDADLTNRERGAVALKDLTDLEMADAIVMFGDAPGSYSGQGGRFVEWGVAVGMGIHLVAVGFRGSVFEYLSDVVFAPDAEAAKSYLRSLKLNSSGRVRRAA